MARKRAPGKAVKVVKKLRSGYEGKVQIGLKAKGVEFEYEPVRLPFTKPATRCAYTPDFVITRDNGSLLFCESKGYWDARSRKVMLLVIEQHPDKDIRMLFQADNKINKNSKTRYSDFCIKHNIPFAVSPSGILPEEWLR